jgi:hypothetical protein
VNICALLEREKRRRTREGDDGGREGGELHGVRIVGGRNEGGGEGAHSSDHRANRDEEKEGYPRGHREREEGEAGSTEEKHLSERKSRGKG